MEIEILIFLIWAVSIAAVMLVLFCFKVSDHLLAKMNRARNAGRSIYSKQRGKHDHYH
jgi:hypothetical protein